MDGWLKCKTCNNKNLERINAHDIWFDNEFLGMTLKALAAKEKSK
jgi:hypothetical protein